MNVLHIISTLEIGGVEKQLLEVLKRLNKSKYNSTVCCLTRGGELVSEFLKLGIEVIILKRHFRFDPSIIGQTMSVIREKKIDIVHTYMFTANSWGTLAARLAGVQVIINSVRDIEVWKRCHHRFIDRALFPSVDCVITNSDATRDFMVQKGGLDPSKFTTFYNGIDTSGFSPGLSHKYPLPIISKNPLPFAGVARGDPEEFLQTRLWREAGVRGNSSIIGTVARLDEPKKGLKYLITAMETVTKEFPDCRLIIIGEGPSRGALEALVESKELKRSVEFLGYRKDIPELLSGMDVFVLPSLWEGFGNVILEAMAMEIPVVATNTGGIPEVVADGKTGVLVPPADTRALADAIIKLLKSPQIRAEMGKAGRSRVEENFKIEKTVDTLESLYDKFSPAR